MKIRVFSSSHNSHRYAVNCIESVARQSIVPYEHYFIDDCSKDDTHEHLNANSERLFSLIDDRYKITFKALKDTNNPEDRRYKLLNLYEYVTECDEDDVICVLDGDDWLANPDVLKKIKEAYEDPKTRYVYTNWIYSHNSELGISKKIPNSEWNPYESEWITSAMSTFKVKEFLKIPMSNFLRWDYKWFSMGCDQAYVLPMLWQIWQEEGNYDSVKFIDEPLYVYQFEENPHKLRKDKDKKSTFMRTDAYNSVEFIRSRGYVNWEY